MPFLPRLTVFAAVLLFTYDAIANPIGGEQTVNARVVTKCTVHNTVALTFDDGPYSYMQEIVDTLDRANAKGTFFLNGNNYNCIYDPASAVRVKYAYSHKHQIASHTWSHAHLPQLSKSQIESEFARTDTAIIKITGAKPAFVRPPYGEYSNDVLAVAGAHGQTVTIWDFDSGDSAGHSAAQSKATYDYTIKDHPSTILALNHETYSATAREVLPYAIEKLQGAGYQLVTLAECLGQKPYSIIGKAGKRDASWNCN